MPIIKKPTEEPVVEDHIVEPVEEEAFMEEVVDSEFIPSSALLVHIAGSEWNCNFYQQYLTEGSAGTGFSLETPAVHQQYRLVKDYIIKVETALTSTQNDDTREFETTGEGYVTPPLVPKIGDCFVADMGDGTAGLFNITRVSRKSRFKDAVYLIAYSLMGPVTDEINTSLEEKTQRTDHYHEDFLTEGLNPIIHSTAVQQIMDFREAVNELIEIHYQEFYDVSTSTLAAPGVDKTYDPYLTENYTKLISNAELAGKKMPLRLDCTGNVGKLVSTVWDCILKRDDSLLYLTAQRVREVSVSDFSGLPYLGSIAFTDMHKVVWSAVEPTRREKLGGVDSKDLAELLSESPTDVVYTGPTDVDVYDIDIDDYYLFSKPFYENQTESMSALELEVRKYLRREPMDKDKLTSLVSGVSDWSPKQRFFIIPVLVSLLKVALRG